ncbi:FMN-dependent dehydrogenase-domain-containing protein [Mycena latifolia]|nr:FMN-dependent dehydrogenase-domain-containing protein [Mycena latifolia]
MTPAVGPWVTLRLSLTLLSLLWKFDANTMGVAGDYGEGATVDPSTEIAGWYDMTDVWRTAQKDLSPAIGVALRVVRDTKRVCHRHPSPWLLSSFDASDAMEQQNELPLLLLALRIPRKVNPDVAENGTICEAATAGFITGISQYSTVQIAALGTVKAMNKALDTRLVPRLAPGTPAHVMVQQVYPGDFNRPTVLQEIATPKQAGFSAVLVTVDFAAEGWQSRDWRARGDTPTESVQDNACTWADLVWLKDAQNLPVLPKGIFSVEDAVLAYELGPAGMYLSNHGRRQLGGAPAPLQVLMKINKYAPGLARKIPIFADAGIYCANHALKLLALGCSLIGLGRPVQFASTMGKTGVETIQNLRDDMLVEMRQ